MEQARRSWFRGHCGTERDRMNQRRMVITGMSWMGVWLALVYVIGQDCCRRPLPRQRRWCRWH